MYWKRENSQQRWKARGGSLIILETRKERERITGLIGEGVFGEIKLVWMTWIDFLAPPNINNHNQGQRDKHQNISRQHEQTQQNRTSPPTTTAIITNFITDNTIPITTVLLLPTIPRKHPPPRAMPTPSRHHFLTIMTPSTPPPTFPNAGKGILIGLASAAGSILIVGILFAIIYFLKCTHSGRILLERIGRPGEWDDEQAFLREEAEQMERMGERERAEYFRAKGERREEGGSGKRDRYSP